ncbi:carbohydrate kinase [Thermosipho melanesiensis]|uniref:Bifunctional NAD(P)H-hydrate repair enzyme n=2 Tax=Thermosipho melanesiensis TaxID=46541 RepID=A6LNX7_THEM4|nr:bifunctional ADP-dependent NAD(P)H-hydrate dehydratase/NAD(P)H-hydrate epimerase [Thermosipho melanesiensis]ABR31628.1 carbohydrate kinase, YjeF related protein [Thermosipho melanesiensis BI429]APT74657.1 NAD(P)H-hydrate epimerase [Thermosipho melanesiensis]OOC35156.1 carbohydrate kinase [Thermosipho melanesiensis]OOC35366.1 carbohydrate kinase [Thermosipho melanesiensis]OOC36617.1 carbohydrate kinase [Thermosipho melanesiensis]
MRVVSSNEMKMLERKTIEDFGISNLVLMERAGVSTVEVLWRELGNLSQYSFLVFCGPGNNGGDGLVIARELLNFTEAVKVVLISDLTTNESRKNLEIYKSFGGEIIKISKENILDVPKLLENSNVVIDAIFGTGLSRDVKGIYAEVIDYINLYSKFTVSVDIPSGVSADTANVLGTAIRSDLTVTFEYPKVGHFLFPGRALTGKLKVVKIGMPKILSTIYPCDKLLLTNEHFTVPNRLKESNKSSYGKVIIIGGSKEFIGAPLLSALGAIRAGTGRVYMAGPRDIVKSAVNYEPGIIPIAIENEYFSENDVNIVNNYIDSDTVVVIGPGLGRKNGVGLFVKKIVGSVNVPIIIDADAIYHISNLKDKIKDKDNLVITPHPGEFAKFLGMNISEVKYNYKLVKETSKAYNSIIALKDVTTIISNGESLFFNVTGNSSLSKGGSGDILSGLIAGFIAQNGDVLNGVLLGVYVFGLAAEMYEYEGHNLISEILDYIPKAISEVM